jgi:peroxiredoxin Q/BCP
MRVTLSLLLVCALGACTDAQADKPAADKTTPAADTAAKPAAAAPERKLLEVGAKAPPFALSTHTGEALKLDDLAGKKTLVWFYPKASTGGCTAEGIALTEAYDKLKQKGVEVVGVSFDTPADNKTFADAHGFPFKLLSDVDKAMGIAWGAAADESAGYPRRISYLLDEEGKVLKVYPQVRPTAHAAEVLADLDTLATKGG